MSKIIEVTRGQVYYTVAQLAELFGLSTKTVRKRKNEIAEESERYGRYAVTGSTVNLYAFLDYDKYRKMLADRNARKSVPPFSALEIANMCGGNLTRIIEE